MYEQETFAIALGVGAFLALAGCQGNDCPASNSTATTAAVRARQAGSVPAGSAQAVSDQLGEQEKHYDAHRSYIKIHFDDQEMDFAFQWILGSISNGGCELGEALYVASQIEDGSPASWQSEWEKMAQRKEKRADQALAAGHRLTARENYLLASNYYRTALVSMLPDHPKFDALGQKTRAIFKKAAKLFDPPIETIEVPFEKHLLPGYFQKVDNSGEKRKTLIMIGGGETFVEDLYFYIAPAAIARGYHFLTVDLPGQGMLPSQKLFFRADTETQMKAIVDYAYSRPEIDRERLAAYGISNGGYFVPRAATVEKRLKAVVVSAAVVDNYRMFAQMPFAHATAEEVARWSPFKRDTTGAVAWRWGLDPRDVAGQVKKNVGFQFDPSKVSCPFLDLIGAGEYANQEAHKQQDECMKALPNANKKFVITPADEGASSHCIGENRRLMASIVFDWLDDVFADRSARP